MGITSLKLADQWLKVAKKKLPIVNHIIHQYGEMTLKEYIKLFTTEKRVSCQPIEDIHSVVYEYVNGLLGPAIAKRIVTHLNQYPVILTANHHGADYFAQSIQANIIYSLDKFNHPPDVSIIPIFSCGTVPLNNITYAQGILLYYSSDSSGNVFSTVPQKLPLFSGKHKRCMVSAAPPIDTKMIQIARQRISTLKINSDHLEYYISTIDKLLTEDYSDSLVLALKNYSDQSVILNRRIWKKIFHNHSSTPELYSLEFEKITMALLKIDLVNPESLIYKILFHPPSRDQILKTLDGISVCWNNQRLFNRLKLIKDNPASGIPSPGGGSHFFWGVTEQGRRVSLVMQSGSHKITKLIGVDDHGKKREFSLTPHDIIQYIENKELLPTYFTSLLSVLFARGMMCLGGYFQGQYLPEIKEGLIRIFQDKKDYKEWVHHFKSISVHNYLSGMCSVMSSFNQKYLIPAGPIEIIAKGGLSIYDLEKIGDITIKDAHLGGMMETIPDLLTQKERKDPEWKTSLLKDNYYELKNKLLIK